MMVSNYLLVILAITSLAGCNTIHHTTGPAGKLWENYGRETQVGKVQAGGVVHESAACSFDEGHCFDGSCASGSCDPGGCGCGASGCGGCDVGGCNAGGCNAGGCGCGAGGCGGCNVGGCGDRGGMIRGCAGNFCDGRCGGHCGVALYKASFAMQNMGGAARHALRHIPPVARLADHAYAQAAGGCHQGPLGPSTAAVTYPYYTTRGPRDFLMANPPSIGP